MPGASAPPNQRRQSRFGSSGRLYEDRPSLSRSTLHTQGGNEEPQSQDYCDVGRKSPPCPRSSSSSESSSAQCSSMVF